jgi:hypothetical protein
LNAITWAVEFVVKVSLYVLDEVVVSQRQEVLKNLAFEWPVDMFQDLVKAIKDVANAKVVHVEDGANCNIASYTDFWHVIGFLQLLRMANELPSQELRFGELTLRGPRIPSSFFTLGAIDKCDADADWTRWQQQSGTTNSIQSKLLEEQPFQVTGDTAYFLAHETLIPIGFRQRCLQTDIQESVMRRPNGTTAGRLPKLKIDAHRDLNELSEIVTDKFGDLWTGLVPIPIVRFVGEPGDGPGVTREFLILAFQSMLQRGQGDSGGAAALWMYDEQLRTYWFANSSADAHRPYRACGVLLGYAVFLETRLPAAFPSVLYSILLRNLGPNSSRATPTLADLASVRPSLAQGLQDLIAYEGADIADVFPLDWPRAGELSPTTQRTTYVQEYVEWYFMETMSRQIMPLCDGFRAVLGSSTLLQKLVNGAQLEQIICGAETPVDFGAIRSNTELVDWRHPSDDKYIDEFWQALHSFSNAEQRSFLVFVSACARMPPEGWNSFALKVQKNGSGNDRLPTALTCFNLLLLPRYSATGALRTKLLMAISNTEGFGLK